jgi:hypothetical protein
MSRRIDLLMAIFTTICGAVAIAAAAVAGYSTVSAYVWPVTAMIWCWCWYGMTRLNRRLQGQVDDALTMRRRTAGGAS